MTRLDRALIDGDLVVRPFDTADKQVLIDGRDAEFHRFLPEASADPQPLASIHVDDVIVGWIDWDDDRHWLAADEVNVGYNIFPDHRGRRRGTRALTLLCEWLGQLTPPLRPTLLIDPDNAASLALARRAGFQQTGIVDGEILHTLASDTD